MDRGTVLGRAFGNVYVLRELVQLFFAECPLLLQSIRDCIGRHDAPELEKAVSSLRDAVSQFGPSEASETVDKLIASSREADFTHAQDLLFRLEKSLQQLQPTLAAFATPDSR
jgi:hypothetical protein